MAAATAWLFCYIYLNLCRCSLPAGCVDAWAAGVGVDAGAGVGVDAWTAAVGVDALDVVGVDAWAAAVGAAAVGAAAVGVAAVDVVGVDAWAAAVGPKYLPDHRSDVHRYSDPSLT